MRNLERRNGRVDDKDVWVAREGMESEWKGKGKNEWKGQEDE